MKYQANIKALAALEPDFMGFIFYPPSKRFIGVEFEKQDIEHLNPAIKRTAVFVNAQFHEIVEFANLYGISPLLVDKLMPYIKIVGGAFVKNRNEYWNSYNGAPKETWVIDINLADEKEWVQKTGLSKSVISRILNYKNYLGAFEHIGQIKKVYGISDEDYQFIKPHLSLSTVHSILLNANTMNFKKWETLGLFSHKEIGEIIQRRKQNGGRIGWREIVIMCDLTETQANGLKAKVDIKD